MTVPVDSTDERTHRRILAEAINRLQQNTISQSVYAASLTAAKVMFVAGLLIAHGVAVHVAGRDAVADGYQGVFFYDATDTTTTFPSDGLGFVDSQGRRFKRTHGGLVFAHWFGAKGDTDALGAGGTDDTVALEDWLSSAGTAYYASGILTSLPGKLVLPEGRFKHIRTLTIPDSAYVSGVSNKSTFHPTDGIALDAVVQGAGSVLENVVIDGYNTWSKRGLSIGPSAQVNNGVTRSVLSVRFLGPSNGIALQVTQAVIWSFEDSYFGDSVRGGNIVYSANGTPTTLTFRNCVFKGNSTIGLGIYTGQEIVLDGVVCEQNGSLGLEVNISGGGGGGAALFNITLQGQCYFESNQLSLASGATRHAAYHAYFRAKRVALRDVFFAHAGDQSAYLTEARAFQMDSTEDFLIDHVDVAVEAGQISIIGSSTGTVSNWNDACGDFNTTISDSTSFGSIRFLYERHGTFTPVLTFAVPGTFAVAYSKQNGRFSRNGNSVTVELDLVTSTFTLGTATGLASVIGLPYTSKNVTNNDAIGALSWQGITKANYTDWVAHVGPASTAINFYGSGSGQNQANLSAADMPTGGPVILQSTINYEIGPASP